MRGQEFQESTAEKDTLSTPTPEPAGSPNFQKPVYLKATGSGHSTKRQTDTPATPLQTHQINSM